MVDQSQKLSNFRDPKQILNSAHQCNKLHKIWDATIGSEEHADISSYQPLPADKNTKIY